jgi:beta-fructofuranosidase
MKYLYCLLLVLLPFDFVTGQTIWSFEGNSPFLSQTDKEKMDYHSIKKSPETVEGLKGKAIRTDGYSTWLSFSAHKRVASLSGWFALESFPTDTATFIGIKDTSNNSIAVSVDCYGNTLLGIGEKGSYTYSSLHTRLNCFSWIHVLLDLESKSVYINGIKKSSHQWTKLDSDGESYIQIGKDFRYKSTGLYDVTTINGLIDEICVSDKHIDIDAYRVNIDIQLRKKPVLAIPKVRFADDFNRPHYHLLPAANWTNETHGLIYYNGKYHIFNQKNASAIFLGRINWGHFDSPDLIHWTEEKPALRPDTTYDKDGIWSGCAVINNEGIPQIIYTGGSAETSIGIAFPQDKQLIEWTKYTNNPIIASHPAEYTRTDMRDPYVWKEGDNWYMIIGYGIGGNESQHGALLLYKSQDLKKWEYLHSLFEGNPKTDHTGIFWEMPVFKKIGHKYVLLVNRVPYHGIPAKCQYWIGEFKNERFIPDNPMPKNLEVINRLLSPSVIEMPNGDIAAIAIIPDEIGNEPTYRQGWAHLYSIPRKWELKNDKICQSPLPALSRLRCQHISISRQTIVKMKLCRKNKSWHQQEVIATFYPADATRFGFTLCKNPDGSEYSRIYYDIGKQELVVDQTRSSLRKLIPLNIRKQKYVLDTTRPVEIQLLIDGSVVEGFINHQDAFTTRIFPSKENSTLLDFFTDGNHTEVKADIWKIKDAKVKMNF